MNSIWSRIRDAVAGLVRGTAASDAGGGLSWLGSGGGEKHQRGWDAEGFAVGRLTGRGYHILGRNVPVGPGEIDIVAEHDRRLVFIEVRSRREDSPVRPVATLTAEKSARVIACGEAYISSKGLSYDEVRPRYDIAEVYLDDDGRPGRFRLLEAAVTDDRRR